MLPIKSKCLIMKNLFYPIINICYYLFGKNVFLYSFQHLSTYNDKINIMKRLIYFKI